MAWNREHVGVAAAPPVAIDWSVTAMTEAAGRLAEARISDRPRTAAAVAEAVWWVTLVDATLVRYHPRGYETALAGKAVRRRKTEETLEGLRYVRNQLGKSVDPAAFIRPASHEGTAAWAWRRQPEPGLGDLSARARRWELGRYRAYQERLAGHDIARTFTRCTEFLAQAASLAGENDTPDGVGAGASQNLDGLVPFGRGQQPASRREVRADRAMPESLTVARVMTLIAFLISQFQPQASARSRSRRVPATTPGR